MKKHTKLVILAIITAALLLLNFTNVASEAHYVFEKVEVIKEVEKKDPLSHQQRVWMGALEWCESHGTDVTNPNDKDNTPSYYWFQFKPGTFRTYGEKYGLIPKGKTDAQIMKLMKNYDLTAKIMEQMILDKTISAKTWSKSLFPGCIKKLGLPPKTPTSPQLSTPKN